MKKNEKLSLRTRKLEELKKTVSEKKRELLKNLKKRKNLRREIAQILTIIRERELDKQSL